METQELTPALKKQITLAKRRAYYSANKDMIRQRDNHSQSRRYQSDPEPQKRAQERYRKRQTEIPKQQKQIIDSPDFLQFVYAVMAEERLLSPV